MCVCLCLHVRITNNAKRGTIVYSVLSSYVIIHSWLIAVRPYLRVMQLCPNGYSNWRLGLQGTTVIDLQYVG
jgi:hypothetical protein